jgi:hypothetical protein
VGDTGGWSQSPFLVGVPAVGQPGPPRGVQAPAGAPPSDVWVLQAELPPRLMLLPPPLLLPACVVCSCTECCREAVGGRWELRVCTATAAQQHTPGVQGVCDAHKQLEVTSVKQLAAT